MSSSVVRSQVVHRTKKAHLATVAVLGCINVALRYHLGCTLESTPWDLLIISDQPEQKKRRLISWQ